LRLRNRRILLWIHPAITAFAAFMVTGRLLSGVHWFSDIIGAALLSAGLVLMYRAACRCLPTD
jgi:undecaprenyl-diphosphatase